MLLACATKAYYTENKVWRESIEALAGADFRAQAEIIGREKRYELCWRPALARRGD